MPTVFREGPYRFFFYANENNEPPHIHVQRDRALAKFWMRPIGLARNTGFSSHELSKVIKIIEDHQFQIEEAWHDFFNN